MQDHEFWLACNQGTKILKSSKIPVVVPKPQQKPINKSIQQLSKQLPLQMQLDSCFGIEKLRSRPIVPVARLDLHGLTKAQAEIIIPQFLQRYSLHPDNISSIKNAGFLWVQIITGKSGVFFTYIPEFLKTHCAHLVSGYAHARPRDGGHGALLVRLRHRNIY